MTASLTLHSQLELDTDEICKKLWITSSNASVILYRARVRVRECLDLDWFGKQARGQ
jgi:RNA polymerase sigma-70 factor (ECF subfamily)